MDKEQEHDPTVGDLEERHAPDTVTALEERQAPLLKHLAELKVRSTAEQRNAEDLLISARYALKEAQQKRMELTRPLDEAKGRIIDMFKPYINRIETGIGILTRELNQYHAYLLQLRQAEEERAMREAAARAQEAQETGEVQAPPDDAEIDVPIVPKTSRGPMGSVTYRQEYEIKVVRPDLVPRDLCEPNIPKIRARVKSGVTDIPGVLVTTKTVPVARR